MLDLIYSITIFSIIGILLYIGYIDIKDYIERR